MPFANFESLCHGLCELHGFPPPALAPADNGTVAFSMLLKGVPVTVSQRRAGAADTALLVAELDSVREEQALAEWMALLSCNAAMPGADSPRLSRNPKSGEPVLLWPCSLNDMTLTDVFERICRMVELATSWQRDRAQLSPLSLNLQVPGKRALDETALAAAADRFAALYAQMCEASGQVAGPVPAGLERGFSMRIQGLDMGVAHWPQYKPQSLALAVSITSLFPEVLLHNVTQMMDLNFVAGLEPNGPFICRDPFQGEVLLRYDYPFDDTTTGQDCLTRMTGYAVAARNWAMA